MKIQPVDHHRSGQANVAEQARLLETVDSAWHAAKFGNMDLIMKLFPGGDVYARGPVGENVFHIAMLSNTPSSLGIVRYLVRHYGSELVNCPYQQRHTRLDPLGMYEGETALHIAIVNRDLDMVKFLIQNGASVHARCVGTFFKRGNPCYYGEYPLAFAASLGLLEIAKYLKRHGAHVSARDQYGNTALHLSVYHNQVEMHDFLSSFLNPAEVLDLRNNDGRSPLSLAVEMGRWDMFRHIQASKSKTLWAYGPVTALYAPLNDVDTNPQEARGMSAIDTIARSCDPTLLSDELIQIIISTKWQRYGRITHFLSLLFILATVVLYTVLVASSTTANSFHALVTATTVFTAVELGPVFLDYLLWLIVEVRRLRALGAMQVAYPGLYPIPGARIHPNDVMTSAEITGSSFRRGRRVSIDASRGRGKEHVLGTPARAGAGAGVAAGSDLFAKTTTTARSYTSLSEAGNDSSLRAGQSLLPRANSVETMREGRTVDTDLLPLGENGEESSVAPARLLGTEATVGRGDRAARQPRERRGSTKDEPMDEGESVFGQSHGGGAGSVGGTNTAASQPDHLRDQGSHVSDVPEEAVVSGSALATPGQAVQAPSTASSSSSSSSPIVGVAAAIMKAHLSVKASSVMPKLSWTLALVFGVIHGGLRLPLLPSVAFDTSLSAQWADATLGLGALMAWLTLLDALRPLPFLAIARAVLLLDLSILRVFTVLPAYVFVLFAFGTALHAVQYVPPISGGHLRGDTYVNAVETMLDASLLQVDFRTVVGTLGGVRAVVTGALYVGFIAITVALIALVIGVVVSTFIAEHGPSAQAQGLSTLARLRWLIRYSHRLRFMGLARWVDIGDGFYDPRVQRTVRWLMYEHVNPSFNDESREDGRRDIGKTDDD